MHENQKFFGPNAFFWSAKKVPFMDFIQNMSKAPSKCLSKWINGIISKTAHRIFFLFYILIFIYFFKYETISTFAPTFWTHIISELDGVIRNVTLTK